MYVLLKIEHNYVIVGHYVVLSSLRLSPFGIIYPIANQNDIDDCTVGPMVKAVFSLQPMRCAEVSSVTGSSPAQDNYFWITQIIVQIFIVSFNCSYKSSLQLRNCQHRQIP